MYLNHRPRQMPGGSLQTRQRGVVLLVALIVLVAMTLAGVVLIRSVDTANVIAGNLAFHESATHAGERSTEAALAKWLQPNSVLGNETLYANNAAAGYRAFRTTKKDTNKLDEDTDPATDESWDAFWARILAAQSVAAIPAGETCANATPDPAGNTVCYVIHRLCEKADMKPNIPDNPCTQPPPSTSSGGSQSVGLPPAAAPKPVYYRITTRIEGPRRTVSYVQTIVAL